MKGKQKPVKGVSNTLIRTFRIYPGDDKLIEYIAETLATSKSDAVRTAIRTQASLLAQIEKRL